MFERPALLRELLLDFETLEFLFADDFLEDELLKFDLPLFTFDLVAPLLLLVERCGVPTERCDFPLLVFDLVALLLFLVERCGVLVERFGLLLFALFRLLRIAPLPLLFLLTSAFLVAPFPLVFPLIGDLVAERSGVTFLLFLLLTVP